MAKQPKVVDIDLTVRVDFGEPHEPVVLIDDRKVPFTDSMFKLRGQLVQLLAGSVVQAASIRPKVWAEVFFVSPKRIGKMFGKSKKNQKPA